MERLLDFVLTDQAGVFIVCANDLPFYYHKIEIRNIYYYFPPLYCRLFYSHLCKHIIILYHYYANGYIT